MGVHDVEARGRAQVEPGGALLRPGGACAQLARGAGQLLGSRRELEQLHLQPRGAPQRFDLIAHEAPALRVLGIGEHVRDDQRAQHPLDRSALE